MGPIAGNWRYAPGTRVWPCSATLLYGVGAIFRLRFNALKWYNTRVFNHLPGISAMLFTVLSPIGPTVATATENDLNPKGEISKNCNWCHNVFLVRTRWQTFCGTKCRNAYHKHIQTVELERLQKRVALLSRANADLQRELQIAHRTIESLKYF